MSIKTVSSGVSSSLIVSSGEELRVLSGGYVYSTTILDGGVEVLSAGALANGETISSGGEAILSAGSLAENLTVSAGGKLLGPGELGVDSDDNIYGLISGVVLGDAVSGYGIVSLESGGVASGVVLHNGRLYVSSGGKAYKSLITFSGGNLGTSYEDVSGLSVSALVRSGGIEYVESGGISEDAVLSSGGSAVVSSGGLASGLIIEGGASALIGPSGRISHITVRSGGLVVDELLVSSGQHVGYFPTLSGITLNSGGTVKLFDPTVLSGGTLTLSAGAVVSGGATVSAGGKLIGPGEIGDGSSDYIYGAISGVVLGDAVTGYSIGYLESGGVASGVVLDNSRFFVSAGAKAVGTVIKYVGGNLGNPYEDVLGASVSAVVRSGGFEYVESGGITEGAIISSGGSAVISSGGLASAIVVNTGGVAFISSGGHLVHAAIKSGGKLFDELVVSGGQHVGFGPTLSGVTLFSGGFIELVNPTALSGGTLTLSSGAIVSGATVSHGGKLVGPGAIGYNSTDYFYGAVSGVALGDGVTGYSIANLQSGGVASGVVLDNGRLYVSAGAKAVGTVIRFTGGDFGGSFEDVFGASVGAVVRSGGVEYVESGGITEGAIVSGGGSAIVSSGGVASAIVVESGGFALINSGGHLVHATIRSGGKLIDEMVISGGQHVDFGPSLAGVTLNSGGVLVLIPTVLSGGGLTLASGAIISAATVSAGGKLVGPGEIGDNSTDYIYGAISGVVLGDAVTGYSIASMGSGGVASGVVLENGRLTVSSGAKSFDTVITTDSGNLGGSYEDVYGLSVSALVRSGGVEYVESGGIGEGAVISNGGSAVIESGGFASGLVTGSGATLNDGGEVRISGSGKLDGALTGGGVVLKIGGGDLLISGAGAGFGGKVVVSGGVIELATSGAIGSGLVEFAAPASGSAGLQIDAGDAPSAGGAFADKIDNFSAANEDIDLRDLGFATGATARVSGATLVLTDDHNTYRFNLGGSIAGGGYSVTSDGHGGTLIETKTALFTQAAAAFAPSGAVRTAVAPSVTHAEAASFLQPTASAGVGR